MDWREFKPSSGTGAQRRADIVAPAKGAHVELGLLGIIGLLGADGAGVTGPAAALHAIGSTRGMKMIRASGRVVSGRRKRADGTRAKAGLSRACVAGAWTPVDRRQFEQLAKRERAAPGVPQAPIGMNQHSEWRRVKRLRFSTPALEWQPWRPTEGKKCSGVELLRQIANYPPRPAVERIGRAVRRFRRTGEGRPIRPPRKAQQDQCAGVVAGGILGVGVKRAAPCQPRRLDGTPDIGNVHMFRRYCPPTSNSVSLIWPSEQTRTASIRTANTFSLRITAWRRRSRMAGASDSWRA